MAEEKNPVMEDNVTLNNIDVMTNICKEAFHNKLIQEYIENNGFIDSCDYLNRTSRKVCSIIDIAKFVNKIVFEYYGKIEKECPKWTEIDDIIDEDGDNYFKGRRLPGNHSAETLYDVIDKYLKVESESIKTAIKSCLNNVDIIIKDAHYFTREELDWEVYNEIFLDIKNVSKDEEFSLDKFKDFHLKHKQEFYEINNRIAQLPQEFKLFEEKNLQVFRCVNYDEIKTDKKYFSAPPKNKTNPQRMSAKGESVFYVSFDKNTTLIESTENNPNKYKHVCCFKSKIPIRLLNLSELENMNIGIFDYNQDTYEIYTFLKHFSEEISKPTNQTMFPGFENILPKETNPIEYQISQIITYNLKNCLKPNFNGEKKDIQGIIYNSSKKNSKNIVLFFDDQTTYEYMDLINCEIHFNNRIVDVIDFQNYQ